MTRDEQLLAMGASCKEHLSKADALTVATAATQHSKRFCVLLSSYAGQTVTGEECAALMLSLAKRVVSEQADAS